MDYFVTLWFGLWCLMSLSTIFGGGNQSTWRKPPTCHKSLIHFIT